MPTFSVEESFDIEASDIDRMEKTPLALFSTYKLSLKLNRELLFPTQARSQLSCGEKRDWKGLEDHCLKWRNDRGEPGLTNDEKPISQLQKQDPTSHIINKWSKRKGVFVKDLLDCLVNIDRYDIIEEVIEDMKECCRNHENNISDAHQWITETHTTTTTIRVSFNFFKTRFKVNNVPYHIIYIYNMLHLLKLVYDFLGSKSFKSRRTTT